MTLSRRKIGLKAKGQRGFSEENGTMQGRILQREGDKGKGRGRPFLLGGCTYKCGFGAGLKIENYRLN
jgi:hypothetical protein